VNPIGDPYPESHEGGQQQLTGFSARYGLDEPPSRTPENGAARRNQAIINMPVPLSPFPQLLINDKYTSRRNSMYFVLGEDVKNYKQFLESIKPKFEEHARLYVIANPNWKKESPREYNINSLQKHFNYTDEMIANLAKGSPK
jgi:hypothetical protein